MQPFDEPLFPMPDPSRPQGPGQDPKPTPLDRYLQRLPEKDRTTVTTLIGQFPGLARRDPDILANAEALGFKPEMAMQHPELVMQALKQNQLTRELAKMESIATRELLANPDFLALAWDDASNLTASESLLAYFDAGRAQNEAGHLTNKIVGMRQRGEEVPEHLYARLADANARIRHAKAKPRDTSFLGGILQETARQGGRYADDAPTILASAALGVALAPILLPAGVGVGAAMGAGAAYGATAGMTVSMAEAEAGNFVLEYGDNRVLGLTLEQMEQYGLEPGAGLDPALVSQLAAQYGMVAGALETAGVGIMAAPFKSALKNEIKKRILKELVTGQVGGILPNLAKGVLRGELGEQATELAQTIAEYEFAGAGIRAQGIEDPRGELVDQLAETVVKTFQGSILFSSAGPVMQAFSERNRVARSQESAQWIRAMSNGIKETKLSQRSKRRLAQFIERASLNSEVKDLYFTVEDFDAVLKQVGVTREEVLTNAPQLKSAFDEADQTGTVRVPLQDWGAEFMSGPLGEALTDHARVDPEEASAAELQAMDPSFTQELLERGEEALEKQVEDRETWIEEAAEIQSVVEEELVATGMPRKQAVQLSKFYRAHSLLGAAALQASPAEWQQMRGITFGELLEEGASVQQQEEALDKLRTTPEFLQRFEGSKIVDEEGAPLRVFHATAADYAGRPRAGTEFTGSGVLHFGPPGTAEQFGRGTNVTTYEGVEADILGAEDAVRERGPRTFPAYLDIKNPVRLEDKGSWTNYTVGEQLGEGRTDDWVDALKTSGWDGVVYLNRYEVPGVPMKEVHERLRAWGRANPDRVKQMGLPINLDTGNASAAELQELMTDEEFSEVIPEAQDSYIVFDNEQVISAISLDKLVSTRQPYSEDRAKRVGDPSKELLDTRYPTVDADPNAKSKNVKTIRELPILRKVEGETEDQTIRRYIDQMRDNLIWLYKMMPVTDQRRARQWYKGGRVIVETLANRHGLSTRQVAAMLAVLSPQKNWYQNVSWLERVLDTALAMPSWTKDMDALTASATILYPSKPDKTRFTKAELQSLVFGKSLREVLDSGHPHARLLAAYWIRLYDKANNKPQLKVILPEGGTSTEDFDTMIQWGSYVNAAKVLSLMDDGSMENVSEQLGVAHKVRSFYNNLFDPDDPNSVTIDTHAVAAAYLLPLAGEHQFVKQAWGSSGGATSANTGLLGLYPYLHQAYEEAARIVSRIEGEPVIAREMQSITWEGVRGLFTDKQKKEKDPGAKKGDPPAIYRKVEAVWSRYVSGEIEIGQARTEVWNEAAGIESPSWRESPPSTRYSSSYETKSGVRPWVELGKVEPPATLGVEAKPNLNPMFSVRWSYLSPAERTRATRMILDIATREAMKRYQTEGYTKQQRGAWMGTPEESMGLLLARADNAVEIADFLGRFLFQEAVMVMALKPGPGLAKTEGFTITLPEGTTAAQIDDLYTNYLWPLKIGRGKKATQPLVGHSTMDGTMVIALDEESSKSAGELLTKIENAIKKSKLDATVASKPVYLAFRNAKEHYGVKLEPEAEVPAGSPAVERDPADIGRETFVRVFRALELQRDEAVQPPEAGDVLGPGRVRGGAELLAPPSGPDSVEAQVGRPALTGLQTPVMIDGVMEEVGPVKGLREVIAKYMAVAGLTHRPPTRFVPLDPARAARIAQAYEDMAHDPTNPEVAAAYKAMADETKAQYQALLDAGYTFEFMPEGQDPYGNPRNAIKDLRDNKHMFVFPTNDGYGTEGISEQDMKENPLLQDSGFKFGDKPALVNDLFRAVHDAFGHSEGNGFRARGEETAWQLHVSTFSPLAARAVTSETRGQNSWVNFGPHAAFNRTASPADTVYAPQKIGLLPEWVMTEGFEGALPTPKPLPAEKTPAPEATTYRKRTRGDVVKDEKAVRKQEREMQREGRAKKKAWSKVDDLEARRKMKRVARIIPALRRIELTKDATLTDVVHELGHFFMLELVDLVSQGLIKDEAMAASMGEDVDTLLRWFQIGGNTPADRIAKWNSMSMDEQRKHHEAFARNFEIYVHEGKAPTPALQRVFNRFRRWLTGLWQELRRVANLEYRELFGEDLPMLTDDVRRVMDRMLASQEAVSKAEQEARLGPMFTSREQFVAAGLDEDDWSTYEAEAEAAREQAVTDVTVQSMKPLAWLKNARSKLMRQIQARKKAALERAEESVRAELEQERPYATMAALRQQTKAGKINLDQAREALRKMAPDGLDEKKLDAWVESTIKRLGHHKNGVLSKDGLPVEVLAMSYGYETGTEMLRELAYAPPFEERVEQLGRIRAMQEAGELFDDRAVERMIQKALHSEARAKFLRRELSLLQRVSPSVSAIKKAAQTAARRLLGQRRVRELSARKASRAEAAAGRRAHIALLEGNTEAAAKAKREQVMANEITRQSIEAEETVAKVLNDTVPIAKRNDKTLGKTHELALVNVARVLLAQAGLLSDRVRDKALGFLQELKAVDEVLHDEVMPMVNAAVENPVDYRDMTFDQFQGYMAMVEGLLWKAREEKRVEVNGKREERESVILSIVEQLGGVGPNDPIVTAATKEEKRGRSIAGSRANLLKLEHLLRHLDGGQTGPLLSALFDPTRQALDDYRADQMVVLKKLVDIVKKIPRTPGEIAAPELGPNIVFGRGNGGVGIMELVGALVHIGNLGNKERLVGGRKWGETLDDGSVDFSKWDAFQQRMVDQGILTQAHFDAVQEIWDLLEQIKPILQKAHRSLTGQLFEAVKADEFTVSFPDGTSKTYRGGYAPATPDPDLMPSMNVVPSYEEMGSEFVRSMPTVRAGFVKSRVAGYHGRPLALDLQVISAHIDQALRFAHVQPKLADLAKLLKDDRVNAALGQVNPSLRQQIIDWMDRVASQSLYEKGMDPTADRFWKFIRRNSGIAIMFGNVVNTAMQLTGLSNSYLYVKAGYMHSAAARYFSGRIGDAPRKMSKSLDERIENQAFGLTQELREMTHEEGLVAAMQRFGIKYGYFAQSWMQKHVDTITWVAAYDQAMAELPAELVGEERQAAAVRDADRIVRLAQGSFNPEDVARYEVGSPWHRTWTQFTGYFNTVLNQIQFSPSTKLRAIVLAFSIPLIASEVIAKLMWGDWGEEDDEDAWVDNTLDIALYSQLRGIAPMIPGFGPALASGVEVALGTERSSGRATASSAAMSSALQAFTSLAGIATDFATGETPSDYQVAQALRGLTVFSGIPVAPVGRVLQGLMKEADPEEGSAGWRLPLRLVTGR